MGLAPGAYRLFDLLEAETGQLAKRIVAGLRSMDDEGSPYAGLPAEELQAVIEGGIVLALRAVREERPPTEEELTLAAAIAEQRAEQGFDSEAVLHGVRVGVREAFVAIPDLAGEADVDVHTAIELTTALWDWVDVVSVEITRAHREVELDAARRDEQQRGALLHGLVFGTLSHQQLLAGAAAYRLEPEAEHLAVRVRPTAECDARRVERLLQPARWTAGVVGVVDNDVVAVLRELPPTELPVTAGVGPPAVLGALSRSFAMAGRALEAALAFGRIGWHRLDDLSVRAAVVADDMVGELLDRCYLSALADLGPFGDELLTSVRTFFAHEQNVDVAARALFVHPNTLRHRLRRFEEVVGVNLRNPDHLVEVWWTLRRGDLRGDGP